MKKRISMILLTLFVVCIALTGCGKSSSSNASMSDIKSAMMSADSSLPDMTQTDSSSDNAKKLFTYISDMDYSKVKSYFMAYSSKGLADEIAVIELKNANDAQKAKESLKAHRDDRVNLFNNYQPSQAGRAQNALIFTQDNYAVLIISDNQNDIKNAFEKTVKGGNK